MQDPNTVHQALEFFKKHQINPKYEVPYKSEMTTSLCLWEMSDGSVQQMDVRVDLSYEDAPVRSLRYVNKTYSEYVKNEDIEDGAFRVYLQLSKLDALCEYLFLDTFTFARDMAKRNMHVFNVNKWLLDLLVRASMRNLHSDTWSVHFKTLNAVVQSYDRYKTLYILDKLWSDFRFGDEQP